MKVIILALVLSLVGCKGGGTGSSRGDSTPAPDRQEECKVPQFDLKKINSSISINWEALKDNRCDDVVDQRDCQLANLSVVIAYAYKETGEKVLSDVTKYPEYVEVIEHVKLNGKRDLSAENIKNIWCGK